MTSSAAGRDSEVARVRTGDERKEERPDGTLLGVSAVPTRTRGVSAAGVLEVAGCQLLLAVLVRRVHTDRRYGSTARCTRATSRLAERSPAFRR